MWELVSISKTCFCTLTVCSLVTFLRIHVGVKLLPKGGPLVTTTRSTHTKTHFPTRRLGSDGMPNGESLCCFGEAEKFSP